jgi:hypothetical protein
MSLPTSNEALATKLQSFFAHFKPTAVYHDTSYWYIEFETTALRDNAFRLLNNGTFEGFKLRLTQLQMQKPKFEPLR